MGQARIGWRRATAWAVVVVLLAGALSIVLAPSAAAETDKEDVKNYSLYQLSSNAAAYFNEMNSPERDDEWTSEWKSVLQSPATGGDFLGYFDENFSIWNVTGWLASELTGSTQTYTYDSLDVKGKEYTGLIDYAHYGASLRQLGLDSMNSGFADTITRMVTGGTMWLAYVLSMVVSVMFAWVIKILQLVNPFAWFYTGVKAFSDTFASGMIGQEAGQGTSSNMFLHSFQTWVGGWFSTLNNLSWTVMVPLFMALLLIALWRGRKDRGSRIKTFLIRLLYIGVGLPLLGSMYTGILNQFDTSLSAYGSGPTRVVLSTYVDFETWMKDSRLAVPSDVTIDWEDNGPSQDAMTTVRNSALRINIQSNDAFSGISTLSYTGTGDTDAAVTAWEAGSSKLSSKSSGGSGASAFSETLGILSDYMTNDDIAPSDYEAEIKSVLSGSSGYDKEDLKHWFTEPNDYGDVEDFGAESNTQPKPNVHPILSVSDNAKVGLTSSSPGGSTTTFTTNGVTEHCGLKITTDNKSGGQTPKPVACNMSILSSYNYLNTRFNSSSLEIFSSNNVMSGISRQNHSSVSLVGMGFGRYNYYFNSLTLLVCISILGIWYAVGMLAGSVRRYGGLVGAIPFAQLGSVQSIAKVITYTIALVCEIVMTVFLYEFVSQFLLSLPDLLSGPLSEVIQSGFGSVRTGTTTITGLLVIVLTLLSTIMIIGATVALLRVRKSVLKALDEAVSKVVSRFTDTEATPGTGGRGSSLGRAAAAGLGAGAAAAGGKALANRLGQGKVADSVGRTELKDPRNKPGDITPQIGSGTAPKELGTGKGAVPGGQAPGGPKDGTGSGESSSKESSTTEGAGGSSPDAGAPLVVSGGSDSGSGGPGSSDSADKALANEVGQNGGLTDLGTDLSGSGGTSGDGGQGGSSGQPGEASEGAQGAPGQGGSGRDGQGRDGGRGRSGGDGAGRDGKGRDGAGRNGQSGGSGRGAQGRDGSGGGRGADGRTRTSRSGNGSAPGQQPGTVGSGSGSEGPSPRPVDVPGSPAQPGGRSGQASGRSGAERIRRGQGAPAAPVAIGRGRMSGAASPVAPARPGQALPTATGPAAPGQVHQPVPGGTSTQGRTQPGPRPASAPGPRGTGGQGQAPGRLSVPQQTSLQPMPTTGTSGRVPARAAGGQGAPNRSAAQAKQPAPSLRPAQGSPSASSSSGSVRQRVSGALRSDTGRAATEAAIRAASEQAGREASDRLRGDR